MDEFKGSCAQLNQIGIDILDLGENSESELNNSHNNKMIQQVDHQTLHLDSSTGFIFDPTGQLKSFAKPAMFENAP